MHTHYDNLKVSRDAPQEVIRAAYKSLSQKYHPDRHADGEEANRIMRLLNVAYDVLSDPGRRAEHDQWIVEQERIEAMRARRREAPPRPAPGTARPQTARPQAQPRQPRTASGASGATGGAKAGGASAQGASARSAGSKTSQKAEEARPSRGEKTRFRPKPEPRPDGPPPRGQPLPAHLAFLLYIAVGASIVVLLGDWTPSASSTADTPVALVKPARAEEAFPPQPPRYSRPANTPRGMPWPSRSGYLAGYPVLNSNGLSTVTVDNTRNLSDVFLKLVSIEGDAAIPVRTSFVRSGSMFTMENIAPGRYDVRYRSLDSGEIFRSERFDLKEIQEANGTSFANNTLTLYSVMGKSKSVTITESEFP
ncbi:J domain-containing protein [Cupriavidus sp. 2KB_3]|uniref:J domain-containing protein n=1 Tax=Cupriavidus TaxID=106589 RepID=UPI0011F07C63|nr:J domain-containing protein [Cupriavidus campinensis]